jgi:hypothetical protein
MKQALEALDTCHWDYDSEEESYKTFDEDLVNDASEALRQAIKQAEKQEPVAWMVRDSIDGSWYPCAFENPAGAIKGESKPLYAVPQQAEKQEPIAWMVYTLDGASAFVTDNPNNFTEFHSCFALYTAPPPRKEWVGLHWDDMPEEYAGNRSFLDGANWAESRLKEKNGG